MFLEVSEWERALSACMPDFPIAGPHCDSTASLPLTEPPVQKQDAGSQGCLLNFDIRSNHSHKFPGWPINPEQTCSGESQNIREVLCALRSRGEASCCCVQGGCGKQDTRWICGEIPVVTLKQEKTKRQKNDTMYGNDVHTRRYECAHSRESKCYKHVNTSVMAVRWPLVFSDGEQLDPGKHSFIPTGVTADEARAWWPTNGLRRAGE